MSTHPLGLSRQDLAVIRSAPPEFMLPLDVALVFGLPSEDAARRAILRGDFGPYVRIGRRIVLRRDSMAAHLASREVRPGGPAIQPADPS